MLEKDEYVYQLSGNDLALRLNTEGHGERIEAIDKHLKNFRFMWDGMPLQPQIGISYCYVRSPVNHIYLLLGELSTVAELSIATNAPESMQRRGAMHVQRDLKDKVAMMNRLQQALEHDRFCLMAQPIVGVRGMFITKFCCVWKMTLTAGSIRIFSFQLPTSSVCLPQLIYG